MLTKDNLFPSQEKEEKVILVIRKHWFNYVAFFFLAGLMVLPVIGLFLYWNLNPAFMEGNTGSVIIAITSIYLLFMLAVELYGFVNFYLDVYIVTDRRIVDINQDGFFKRKISELNLRQVQDVSAKVNGFFETILHFGNVYVQTAGEQENFAFISIPHPYSTSKKIIELHQLNIGRRGNVVDEKEIKDDVYENLEMQAKSVIKQTPVNERFQNGGIFVNKNESSSDFINKQNSAINSQANQTEGEMIEGKEIDLDNENK